jgi:hypothetical protein
MIGTWLGSLCDGESEHNAPKRPGKARESLGGVCARAQHDARSTRGTAHSQMHMRHGRGAHSYAMLCYDIYDNTDARWARELRHQTRTQLASRSSKAVGRSQQQ